MIDFSKHFEALEAKIKVLNEAVWESRCDYRAIQDWLNQFNGSCGYASDQEKLQMMFLLSNFIFFGSREIRELLKSLFRDLYKYRIVEQIRRSNKDTKDRTIIEKKFNEELRATRFLPVGNPSESGSHLLYYFRQENRLSKRQFINVHEIFAADDSHRVRDGSVKRYIFLDDLCGSGQQGVAYCRNIVIPLKRSKPGVEVIYYVLFATAPGLDKIKSLGSFDDVNCVVELDETFRVFSDASRYYDGIELPFDKDLAKHIASFYGGKLCLGHPRGYKDGQLLLGFSHNVPDNTLPIFWFDEPDGNPWIAIFPRYPKEYGWGQAE
jgi:hypothetical protein